MVSLSNRFLEPCFGCKGKWEGEGGRDLAIREVEVGSRVCGWGWIVLLGGLLIKLK